MGRRPQLGQKRRPMPPSTLIADPLAPLAFAPAPEVLEWLTSEILEDTGRIHNPDHVHLLQANLRILWASGASSSKGRAVIGTAEEVLFRASRWVAARQEQQMREWFGEVPDYLITLDAEYCSRCSDAAFCALVEHECYHIAQDQTPYGAPAFKKDGTPKIRIVGHDVEEFVGVVRRYGVGDPGGALAQLAAAARATPQVSDREIAGACGTCLMRVA